MVTQFESMIQITQFDKYVIEVSDSWNDASFVGIEIIKWVGCEILAWDKLIYENYPMKGYSKLVMIKNVVFGYLVGS